MKIPKILNDLKRFYSKIHLNNDCWQWQANKFPSGYGQFWYENKNMSAHRASWFIHKGNISGRLCVCHKCDNPSCVNPNHLFLGTYEDNMQDMIKKNRRLKTGKILNVAEELLIVKYYESGIKQRDIANIFNVHQRTIWRCIHKHIPTKSLNGENNCNSVLCEDDIKEIRKIYKPYVVSKYYLARKYNVNHSTIERILNRKTWKHI